MTYPSSSLNKFTWIIARLLLSSRKDGWIDWETAWPAVSSYTQIVQFRQRIMSIHADLRFQGLTK